MRRLGTAGFPHIPPVFTNLLAHYRQSESHKEAANESEASPAAAAEVVHDGPQIHDEATLSNPRTFLVLALIGERFEAALNNPRTFLIIALVGYLLFTRLWQLELKSVQHDESMFAYYSYQIIKSVENEYTKIRGGPVFESIASLTKSIQKIPYSVRVTIILLSIAAVVF